ncbi:MAG: hypothetical protein IPP96_09190 [Chitinophagaceae bacterium]|nr:hypothetical protein [Chitinophagaceae bacterium]
MKKLLLASIVMMGISSVAAAQTPEAVRERKEAAKKEANQPVISNAANVTASEKVKTESKVAADKNEAAKPKEAEVKKTALPAAKKVKRG